MEKVEAFRTNVSPKAKIGILCGFFAAIAIIIAVIIILAVSAKTEQIPVEIADFGGAEVVPSSYKNDIRRLIWKMLEGVDGLEDVSVDDAVVREGSYREERNGQAVSAKFIVDIESLHYSFEVSASWVSAGDNSSDPTLHVTCPYYTDVIYTDKKCIAASPIEQLRRYLPHYERLSNGALYTAELRKYDSFQTHAGETYLAVSVPTCDDKIVEEAATDLRKWLKKIYLDPNDYYIEMIRECKR